MSFQESRRFTRVPLCKLLVEVRTPGHAPFPGFTSDVSLGGLFLVCTEGLPVGTACELRFTIGRDPAQVRFEAHGQVVRLAPGGVVFEFTHLPMDSWGKLRNLLLLHAPDAAVIEKELRVHPRTWPGSEG